MKPRALFCFRCGAKRKQVKTYGKMDWCRACVQEMVALGTKVPCPEPVHYEYPAGAHSSAPCSLTFGHKGDCIL